MSTRVHRNKRPHSPRRNHRFCYAVFTESTGYRERDMTLQKFVGIASFFVLCIWGFLVGELHNLKSLFALFF